MRRARTILGATLAVALAPALALAAATITRGQVSDLSVTGGAAVFSSSLLCAGGQRTVRNSAGTIIDNGRGVWWNLTVTIKPGSTASKVYLRKIVDGDTTFDEVLNNDELLTVGARYGFSFQVHPDHAWNVVLGTSTHLATLQVEEEP